MQKKDLEYGNVVETRDGNRYIYIEYFKSDILLDFNGKNQVSIDYYKENLIRKNCSEIDRFLDIMKVYKDYTLQELLWERKEKKEQLTQEEKDYLKAIIKGLNCNATYILKGNYHLEIHLSNSDYICLAHYSNMKFKFENLITCKGYTLKELGLED